jgi:hypothetical protein
LILASTACEALLMVKRVKTSKLIWVSPAIDFAEDESPHARREKIFNVRHQTFDIRPTGSSSSRVSYLSAIASPRKPTNVSDLEIMWNSAHHPLSALDDYSTMDPDYVNYIEDTTGLPPKRRRTAGVSFCLNLIVFS